jgi:hypothetical protein
MAFKRAIILGGIVLLVAACSTSSPTSVREVEGGAASNARAGKGPKKTLPMQGETFNTMADSASCNRSIPVLVGFVDSTCVGQ